MTFLRFLLVIILIQSCSTKKDIIYIQENEQRIDFTTDYDEYKLQVDDILKITVLSPDPEITLGFNMMDGKSNVSSTRDLMIYNGYQINSEGNIHFPTIGDVKIIGLTINQTRSKLYKLISNEGFLKNYSIDVKHINAYFTVLGEVNNPGRYPFTENNLNILEALGIAGDLTITGERKNVKLIREIDNSKQITELDLTRSNFLNDSFQIFPGDIIIVNPNNSRVKNAGLIGNAGNLLSLLSFILSSIIVINN